MTTHVPLATYRLQLTSGFGFAEAAAIVPYLKDLGITHLYASPFLKARAGSTHGYDIVDHNSLNPELGGAAGFEQMSDALKNAGMGLILDFVPNHMGVGFSDNAWWLDVLEWGQISAHARSFDIDWQGLPYRAKPGVLLPILGRPYGDALRAGEIELKYDADAGSFAAWYFDHKLPINPQRYGEILRTCVGAADAERSQAGRALIEIADRYRARNAPTYQEAPELKKALAGTAGVADILNRGLAAYAGIGENSWPTLHRLLERQAYHLAYWRVAFSAINYRRFFDINDLAGIRPEHPATFHAMHALVARLIAEGKLQGIRLDHIDGLRDPAQYVRRLRELIRRVRPQSRRDGFYILIEKILGPNEAFPQFQGVDGTTGYERLDLISRVLLDARGLPDLEKTWREFSAETAQFPDIVAAAKQRVLDTMLASEFNVLTRALGRIAAGHYSSRDFTLGRLRAALHAYVLEFPVYRTYVTASQTSEADRHTADDVIARARAKWMGPDPEIFDFVRDAVTGDLASDRGFSAPRVRGFSLKLQQFTGPLMAKSLEDTAFYRYHRLLALNEVGGEPAAAELSVAEFHREQLRLLKEEPHGLVATATHDTKRGEDARMRILALAEIPGEWLQAVGHWQSLNAKFAETDSRRRRPSHAHEYMLYQSLVGSWPGATPDRTFVERIRAYARKAAREGKQETSWTSPDDAYEAALQRFIDAILDPGRSPQFLRSLSEFAERASLLGALNSLSQIALKLTLPGVPDFFQGTELWDLSLVDPDNRRAVDYQARRILLDIDPRWDDLAAHWRDGRIKFALIRKLLALRHQFADVFRQGDYRPAEIEGADAPHLVGFTRRHAGRQVTAVIWRHFAPLTAVGRNWPRPLDARLAEPESSRREFLRGIDVDGGSRLGEFSGRLPAAIFV